MLHKNVSTTIAVLGSCAVITAAAAITAATLAATTENFIDQQNASFGISYSLQYNASDMYTYRENFVTQSLNHHTRSQARDTLTSGATLFLRTFEGTKTPKERIHGLIDLSIDRLHMDTLYHMH